jgi:hypothetical protein
MSIANDQRFRTSALQLAAREARAGPAWSLAAWSTRPVAATKTATHLGIAPYRHMKSLRCRLFKTRPRGFEPLTFGSVDNEQAAQRGKEPLS